MSIALKRLGAFVMAAILIAGMAPAMKTEAASTALAKPGNCRFVRWREKDDFDDCYIAWNKVAGASGYQTLLTWTDGSHGRWKTWSSTTTTALFKDVEDEHVTQVKVRAIKNTSKGRQYGPWSNIAYITPSPEDHTKKNVSSASAGLQEKLTWEIIYGSSGYNVFLTTNPKGTWYWNQSTPTQATARSAVIKKYRGSNLKKYTNYYFRIVTRRRRNGVFCTVPMPAADYYTGSFRIN
ncbi:MAG: hypothetical protein IKF59_03400 [Lachnospiraceae bacterium]|nr:hypothetical protein [Lachnospiraceae bacterium]